MKITYSDGLGLVEVLLDSSGASFDGSFAYFTDANGRDYKIPCADIFSIVMA